MRISTKSAALITFILLIFFISIWNDFTSQLFQFLVQHFNASSRNRSAGAENTLSKPTEFLENVTTTTPRPLLDPDVYIKSLVSKSNAGANKTAILPDTQKSGDLFPSAWTLGHISMKYLMNNDICNSSGSLVQSPFHPSYNQNQPNESTSHEIFGVILIRSFAGHIGVRNKIREALPTSKLEKLGMRRVFVLAQPPNYIIDWETKTLVKMSEVQEENKQHKDIIMGDFMDTSINSTYKHLMALQWALRYCSNAKYIIHHKDDFLVDVHQLKVRLDKSLGAKLQENFMKIDPVLIGSKDNDTFIDEGKALFFLGYLNEGLLPIENSSRTWENWMRMRRQFPGEYKFPKHVSGGAYVTNVRTAKQIIGVAEKVPFYSMDDIHVTGSLREGATNKIPIPIFNIHERYSYNTSHLAHCVSSVPEYWCPFYFSHAYVAQNIMTAFYQHAESCYQRQSCGERIVSFDPST